MWENWAGGKELFECSKIEMIVWKRQKGFKGKLNWCDEGRSEGKLIFSGKVNLIDDGANDFQIIN